eukprot:13208547-Alexandrium_andersonii.AAC.1
MNPPGVAQKRGSHFAGFTRPSSWLEAANGPQALHPALLHVGLRLIETALQGDLGVLRRSPSMMVSVRE